MAEAPSARQAVFEQQLNYDLARMQSYRMQGSFGRRRYVLRLMLSVRGRKYEKVYDLTKEFVTLFPPAKY